MGVDNHDDLNIEIGKWSKFEINVGNSVNDSIWRRVHSNSERYILMLNVNCADHQDSLPFMTYMSADVSNLPQNLSFILKVVKHDSPAQYLSRSKMVTAPIRKYSNFTIKCELLVYENQQKHLPDKIWELENYLLSTKLILIAEDGYVETTQELLYARSSVIRSMFQIAEKVGDEPLREIKLVDYKQDVLQEFVNFLKSDELSGNTPYASQLLELGHKYDVQLLKKKAEQLVIHYLKNDNIEKNYKLLCVTSADMLAAHLEETFDKLQATLSSKRINLDNYKAKAEVARTLLIDVMEYTMRDIKLVGSDGEITAKRELLMARSTVLRAIFKDESNEKLNGFKYEMKNYTKNVLSEFWNFVLYDEIDPDTENALQLLSLADEYNLSLLKSIATQIVIDNKKKRNVKAIYPVLAKTNPDIMWNHFKAFYEEFKNRNGLIDIDGKLFSKDENKFI